MGAKTKDRRVQRTHQLLRAALLSLIEEKGFEQLTVQDIIDRANVGRATFYAHFDNKEDLLVSGLDGLRLALKDLQRLAHIRRASPDDRLLAFSHEMFAHIAEYRKVFRAMVSKRSGALVQQLLQKIVVDLVRDDIKAMGGRGGDRSAPSEAVVQFVTGGLFGLAMLWATGKLPLSECYPGRKPDERPVRFWLEGKQYEVEAVLDQWYDPDGIFYKIRANAGNFYIIR